MRLGPAGRVDEPSVERFRVSKGVMLDAHDGIPEVDELAFSLFSDTRTSVELARSYLTRPSASTTTPNPGKQQVNPGREGAVGVVNRGLTLRPIAQCLKDESCLGFQGRL